MPRPRQRSVNNTDEEQIDRRAHWVQIAGAAIVAVTAWCVKLEMTTAQLKLDMTNHMAARDITISKIWDKIGADHDELIRDSKDIEWLKKK